MRHETHPLKEDEILLIESKSLRSILAEVSSEEFSCRSCLFFDIETTGLSAETSFLFLIGCICYEAGSWNRHQFCIHLVQEESLLLSSFFEIAKKVRFLIHFNGNTFDIPFIQKRAAAYGLYPPFDDLHSIDLYQHFRPLRKILNLPHMNQSFLEKYIGWEREDRLSGKEVVSLFWYYAAQQNTGRAKSLSPSSGINGVPDEQAAELLLLQHNRDDLLGMLQILKLEAYVMLLSGSISSTAILPEQGTDTGEYLHLAFLTILPLPHPLLLTKPLFIKDEKPANITLSINGSSGELTVPVFCGTLRYYIPDYKNYYYLPLEHQALHKSVASYVAKDYRVPAKPDTCYVEKTGRFLPLPTGVQTSGSVAFLKEKPIFRKNYETKHFYFESTEESDQQEALMLSYARALLTHFWQR
ncbi:MAG: ribonuclease H-like domain-containing protein [Clostridiales bacterium]|nr:ribonuclease H-like domain-containing protein [Clostridiales bacterium]